MFQYKIIPHRKLKQEAVLFLFGGLEVNTTLLINSKLTNQSMQKALFPCVVIIY